MTHAAPNLNYTPFTKADFAAVAELCHEQWYSNLQNGELFAQAELTWQLAHSAWGIVARANDQILGAAFARVNTTYTNPTWADALEAIISQVEALPNAHESGLALDRSEQALMQSADKTHGSDGVGIMQLLIVSAASRGLGVGSHLLRDGVTWLAEQGATRIRLATDDECDWGYYEHLGMTRIATCEMEDGFSHYVYEGPVELFRS